MYMLKTVKNSQNGKIGDMSATYRKVGETCSDLCALLHSKTCYAMFAMVGIQEKQSHYDKFDGMKHFDFIKTLPAKRIVRLHVSGDFFYQNVVDGPYLTAVVRSAYERPDVTQYTYTHDIKQVDAYLKENGLELPKNLTINASCDTWEQVKEYKAMGYPTVITLPHDETRKAFKQDGIQVTVCPSQLRDIKCTDCMLCMIPRTATIGFLAHGTRKQALTDSIQERGD